MYVMKPILEPDVLDLLNNGRFAGEIEGYILSDGADLFGWSLFRIDGDVTSLLDILPPSDMLWTALSVPVLLTAKLVALQNSHSTKTTNT